MATMAVLSSAFGKHIANMCQSSRAQTYRVHQVRRLLKINNASYPSVLQHNALCCAAESNCCTRIQSTNKFDKREMSSDSRMDKLGGDKDFIFKQFLDYKSYTYTYLLADIKTKEAVLIDPVLEMVPRDVQAVLDLGLNLKYAVNTHVHADHITGTGEIKKHIKNCKSLISANSKAQADIKLKAGDLIRFGSHELEVRSTPGHTDGCLSFVWHDKKSIFTGDAVLIRGCGRTDFQHGDAGLLYDSVHNKILSLPKNFSIFPAHDYTGQTSTTVEEELKHNKRLTKTRDEFIKLMTELNLPYPKQIDRALPANMICGIFDELPK